MEYKIEKNIPMPTFKRGDNISLFDQLEVGDSILVESQSKASSFITAARRLAKEARTQRQPDGWVRVWRTK